MYVGKSKNLRARIRSYFSSSLPLRSKTARLVDHIYKVDIVETSSEVEAMLLEASLIRFLLPKYNIRLRDDKSPLYVIVTNEQFPKVVLKRGRELRVTSPSLESNAPLAIFGPFLSSKDIFLLLKRARILFPFCSKQTRDHKPCFYTHLGLCPGACTGTIPQAMYRRSINKLIILLGGDVNTLKRILQKEMRKEVRLRQFEQAATRRDTLVALERLLALPLEEKFEIFPASQSDHIRSLVDVLTKFDIHIDTTKPVRIEGFDVSTLGGRQSTAAMVVFVDERPHHGEYRHFRIRSHNSLDDAGMITEVIKRRLLHDEWHKPDLILIDGGTPQLLSIQKEMRVSTRLPGNIPFLGLAKTDETLVIPHDRHLMHVSLHQGHEGLQLLMNIRDEAHRFCRRYHHRLRDRALLQYNS